MRWGELYPSFFGVFGICLTLKSPLLNRHLPCIAHVHADATFLPSHGLPINLHFYSSSQFFTDLTFLSGNHLISTWSSSSLSFPFSTRALPSWHMFSQISTRVLLSIIQHIASNHVYLSLHLQRGALEQKQEVVMYTGCYCPECGYCKTQYKQELLPLVVCRLSMSTLHLFARLQPAWFQHVGN